MAIGYLTSPPAHGAYVRQAYLRLKPTVRGQGEAGDLSLDWTTWHREASSHEPAGYVLDASVFTRCGRRIAYDTSARSPYVQAVVAVTEDPGDDLCGRCERRPAIDRRFRQLLEEAYQVAMAVAAARGAEVDQDDVRRLVALEVLRRDDRLRQR